MTPENFDRMIDRNDPDINYLLGEWLAAYSLLKLWMPHLSDEQLEKLSAGAKQIYEDRLFAGSDLLKLPEVEDGFRDLLDFFRTRGKLGSIDR